MHSLAAENLSVLTGRLLRDDALVAPLVAGISVPVSDMFRDPAVFKLLRDEVFPVLAFYPRLTIWLAGCANGEEVYSLAILLHEAGLYARTQIHATDFNHAALEQARAGHFDARHAEAYAAHYRLAGGQRALADYLTPRDGRLYVQESLKRNINFASHNLVTDGVFCEAQLILCRNVLIYFNQTLQNQVLERFSDSLVRSGYLCLGHRESLDLMMAGKRFKPVDRETRIYQLFTQ
jgi:chemotaxis protein methyltransferase CheR